MLWARNGSRASSGSLLYPSHVLAGFVTSNFPVRLSATRSGATLGLSLMAKSYT